MKIKVLNILSVMLIGILFVFSACEEKDDYDFSAIEPIIASITGPDEVAAHGLLTELPIRYHVPHRGGSSFAWEVIGHGATIVIDEKFSSIADITFAQSSDTTAATISVVETTMGGIESPAFLREILLTPFCPIDMDALAGEWVGTSGANDSILFATPTGNLNELIIKGLAGFVVFSWGETWTVGDGSCVLLFKCAGLVVIEHQKIGETDFPDTYHIEGEGFYDADAETIDLEYTVFYTGGDSGSITTTLSRDPKSGVFKVWDLKK